ncbi:aldo/keto reductase (plasmid) [Agrobacterium pusense]|uniref:aldo/keto reductase n=1 Tax=Agrobacterium pusense TaxID=648995 RepID=UPI0007D75286|nr:aldo/keto reductase [Agrobacterium pusense]OAI91554.1 hypothetical protein AYO27_24245 [Rhizobium sp. GHKF11]WMW59135.1 aldo/keto reductase [Agrobacterium pusense]
MKGKPVRVSDHTEFLIAGELAVSRLGIGISRAACSGRHAAEQRRELGLALVRRALELGVNFLDTTDYNYSPDRAACANVLIRDAFSPYQPNLVIATSIGLIRDDRNGIRAATGAELRWLVNEKLRQLRLDRLDLVILRLGETLPPHGESLAVRFDALAELREEGLIRHLGLSNADDRHLSEALQIAPVVAVQNLFHFGHQRDVALLRRCEKHNIAYIPFLPLGCTGVTACTPLARIALRHHTTVDQIALRWLLSVSPVTIVAPQIGSVSRLEELVLCRDLPLTAEDMADLA